MNSEEERRVGRSRSCVTCHREVQRVAVGSELEGGVLLVRVASQKQTEHNSSWTASIPTMQGKQARPVLGSLGVNLGRNPCTRRLWPTTTNLILSGINRSSAVCEGSPRLRLPRARPSSSAARGSSARQVRASDGARCGWATRAGRRLFNRGVRNGGSAPWPSMPGNDSIRGPLQAQW